MNFIDILQFSQHFNLKTNDTGNVLTQISFLTNKINRMQLHIKKYGKDIHTKTKLNNDALLRKKMLKRLKENNELLFNQFILYMKEIRKNK